MKVKYDDKKVTISRGLVSAIKNLMKEEILMMRKIHKENADCWQIGVCEIEDLGSAGGYSFMYGKREDKNWIYKKGRIFVNVP